MAGDILSIEDLRTVTKGGVIVSCRAWSETHVSGGSAQKTSHLGPQGGSVTMPGVSITSTTSDKIHLFIRQEDGREFDQTFVNAGVGVREGHRVSIIYVPDEDGEPLALVNHDTGKSRIYEGRVPRLLRAPSAPLIARLTQIYMIALLPLHLLTYYWGFTGKLNHLEPVFGRAGGFFEWMLLNAVLIGVLFLLPMLAPGVASGLKAEVVAAIKRKVDESLAVRPPPATVG